MSPSLVRVLVLAGAAALLALPPLAAQQPRPVALASAAQAQADSVRALRRARNAQADFERLRFRHLPETWDSGSGGYCDEVIGRFCLWHDDGDDEEWAPPPEHRAVEAGRDRLLATLAEAARAAPGDAWIAGQRVRYLLEAGRAAEAAQAARECRAQRWWCLALEGYAHHAGGAYAPADAAFTAAVEAMPARRQREWSDLAPVLPDADARALRRLDPETRAARVRRLWWLADPLWMEPGNDRKTEHYARLVADELQDRARSTEGLAWGDDLREILLRYGEPIGWEKVRPRAGAATFGTASVVTHYAPSGREYLPPVRRLEDPTAVDSSDWTREDYETRTAYVPGYASRVHDLRHQVAVFRRGGAAVVVAAWRLDPDSLPPSPRIRAGLVLARDEQAAPVLAVSEGMGLTGALRVTAEPAATVMSLEVREDSSKRIGRARYGLRLAPAPAGVSLSDLLLLADGEARPGSLEAAVPLARGDTRFRAGEQVGLYWEVYGLQGRTDTLTVTLTLARRGAGWMRRAAERVGLAAESAPVRMRWREEPAGGEVAPRSLGVALPRLAPGAYLLEVTVQAHGAEPAVATRELIVEAAPR
ncbi:MAG TPA: hypothetical protein VFX98_02720 [Longimicrobiaceae bacterium]|nr:hypothetical protein [Longimicrobiaceae bacterium]